MKRIPLIMTALLLAACLAACATPAATPGAASTPDAASTPKATASPDVTTSPSPAAGTPAPTQAKALTDEEYETLGDELMTTEFIGLAQLGMTAADVIAALGQPDSKSELQMWGADGEYHSDWEYADNGLTIGMTGEKEADQKVYSINAKEPCNYVTLKDIKIGSTKAEVLAAYGYAVKDQTDEGTKDSIAAGGTYSGIWFGMKDGLVESIFIGPGAE